MTKIRVYELAKRLGITKEDAVARLRALGHDIKSSLSSVDDDALDADPEVSAGRAPASAPGAPAAARPAAPARPVGSHRATGAARATGGLTPHRPAASGLTSVRPGVAGLRQAPPAARGALPLKRLGVPARSATSPTPPAPAGGPGAAAARSAPPAPASARQAPGAPGRPAGTEPAASSPAAHRTAAPAGAPRAAAAPSAARTSGAGITRPAVTAARPLPARPAALPPPPALAPGARPVAPAAPGKAAAPAALRPPVAIPKPAVPPPSAAPAARPAPSAARPAAPPGTGVRGFGPGAGASVRRIGTGAPAGRYPAPPAPLRRPLGPPRPAAPIVRAPVRPAARPAPRSAAPAAPAAAVETPAPAPVPAARPAPLPVPSGPLKPLTISEGVTVKELAEKMGVKSKDLIRRLLDRGALATINQSLDPDAAVALCRDFGYEARVITFEQEAVELSVEKDTGTGRTIVRPPVVTIMGHVDHGKTTLLDAIRESNIVAREHGGITQHIGAYRVEVKGRRIVFLDTPGHEAFTKMRARGAKVTDMVLLVVAADDGVQPQTVEAIHHARAAGVPIIVAINKIDKPEANPDRVKKALSEHELLVRDWGGQVECVPISARQRKGLDGLLDTVLLVADADLEKELQAHPDRRATGTILEAKLDRTRGPVATVLVQDGTLRVGDPFIGGAVHGKVRAMFDDRGAVIREAGPSIPVEVLGLTDVPQAGDLFQVVSEEAKARQIGSFRQLKLREERVAKSARLTLQHLHERVAEGSVKELQIILKGDVQGSVEVLSKTLQELTSESVKIKILHSAPGAITESDVLLASASNAIIIGFNVRPERKASELAEKEGVDIRLHSVIYEVSDEIKKAMAGLLEPTIREVYLGRAEVRRLFKVPKSGVVAGSYVLDGRIARNASIRLLRDNAVVFKGRIASLRHLKDDVSEVKQEFECGIMLERFNDVKAGDIIEAYRTETVPAGSLSG